MAAVQGRVAVKDEASTLELLFQCKGKRLDIMIYDDRSGSIGVFPEFDYRPQARIGRLIDFGDGCARTFSAAIESAYKLATEGDLDEY